jgi:hypothetical protein
MKFLNTIFFLSFLISTNALAQKSFYEQMKISGMIIPGNPDLKSTSDSKVKLLKNQTLFDRQVANMPFAFVCEMPPNKPCKKGTEKNLGMWGAFPKDVLKQLRINSENKLDRYDVEAYINKENQIDGSKPVILYAYETEGKD